MLISFIIVINSPHGESPIDDTYNTKAETTGVVKMKVKNFIYDYFPFLMPSFSQAPDTVGAYQVRYYPGWLDYWNTIYRHSQCVAVATFEAIALEI